MHPLAPPPGFTLVELLIVVAIVIVLAAILIPTYAGASRKASESAATLHAQTVRTALNTHLAVNPQLTATSLGTLNCTAATTLTASGLTSGSTGNGWDAAPNGSTCTAQPSTARTYRVTVTYSGGTVTVP